MRRPLAQRPTLRALAIVLALAGSLAACGLRTPVRPPEKTAPVIPGVVTATRDGTVTVVRWKRADFSADGEHLDDLTGFVIERKRSGEEVWQRVGTVDVVDQEKIRRRRDFSWRDREGDGAGTYRVLAVCSDGQEGPPTEPALAVDKAAAVNKASAVDNAAAIDKAPAIDAPPATAK
jgi:predicted small lipoprotein YifL